MASISDNSLAEAENILTSYGYRLPIAWAIGFIVDNEKELVRIFKLAERNDFAESISGICAWIGDQEEEDGE
jgi:hypothetical protein